MVGAGWTQGRLDGGAGRTQGRLDGKGSEWSSTFVWLIYKLLLTFFFKQVQLQFVKISVGKCYVTIEEFLSPSLKQELM